ncbi:TPA: Gfo/Idh/MocA family oxidoreductase [bacterium]|nr:Gfo/Idh/MocA family oxidoreductase [bacterium]HPO82651.1 Gfo/Idh/MocA family oxidoreductase [bacterium]
MERVRSAFIGCGGIAGEHVKGLKLLWENDIKTFEVIAVCDIDKDRAEKLAEDVFSFQGYKPKVYANSEEMLLKEPDIQAVDICTIHKEHHTVAIRCLSAKKHVTIEKPLALTMRYAHMILDSAEKNECILQVAENYRRALSERTINWVIKSGRIGKPRMLFWEDISEGLWYWGWRHHKDLAGGGWTLDGGVHFVDLFRYHIGEVEELYAISKTYNPIRFKDRDNLSDPVVIDVEDTIMSVLKFENGTTGTWVLTDSAVGKKTNFRAIYGDKGSIVWNDGLYTRKEYIPLEKLEEEYLNSLSEEKRGRLFPKGIRDTIAIELKEFFDAIIGIGEIETTGLEGLKDEAISMAVYESSWLNIPVKIKDVEDCKIENYQKTLI